MGCVLKSDKGPRSWNTWEYHLVEKAGGDLETKMNEICYTYKSEMHHFNA